MAAMVGAPLGGASRAVLPHGGGVSAFRQGSGLPTGLGSGKLPGGQEEPAGAGDNSGDKPDEYSSPVTAMLKQVHQQLQKDGRPGLPGFGKPPENQPGQLPQGPGSFGLA